jgi:type IV pilus assembly protein PilM
MFRRPANVGLDLGHFSLKCAVLEHGSTAIKKLWQGEILPSRESEDQTPSPQELRGTLQSILSIASRDGVPLDRGASASIQDEAIVFRYIELPELAKKDLDAGVRNVAKKYIPFPLDKVILSHLPVPLIAKKTDKMAVFFIAIPSEPLASLKSLMKDCKIDVRGIIPSEIALTRALVRNYDLPRDQFLALVHTGFHVTQVIIVRDGFPYLIRSFPIAGKKFTYGFQSARTARLAWREAEYKKLEYDATSKNAAVEPFIVAWLAEIEKSLKAFAGLVPGAPQKVSGIFLSGGSAGMKGLDQRLSSHVNLPTTLLTLQNLRLGSNQPIAGHAASYAVALGLAVQD